MKKYVDIINTFLKKPSTMTFIGKSLSMVFSCLQLCIMIAFEAFDKASFNYSYNKT